MTNRADWNPLRADLERFLADVHEAAATDREPEDVQRERHEREIRELEAQPVGRSWWRALTRMFWSLI